MPKASTNARTIADQLVKVVNERARPIKRAAVLSPDGSFDELASDMDLKTGDRCPEYGNRNELHEKLYSDICVVKNENIVTGSSEKGAGI
jgi:hypothetical protein